MTYTLTTQHTTGIKVQTFATYEEALAAGESTSPDLDGSMMPNVDQALYCEETYSRGLFWFGNRYALIHQV